MPLSVCTHGGSPRARLRTKVSSAIGAAWPGALTHVTHPSGNAVVSTTRRMTKLECTPLTPSMRVILFSNSA